MAATPTRRQFLATAAAISAPIIIPASALGLDGTVAPVALPGAATLVAAGDRP